MTQTNASNVYNIPAWVPFLDVLVEYLRIETQTDPLSLSRYLILLPHRRACRSLKEVFLKHARQGVLPRMMALGDLDAGFIELNSLSSKEPMPQAIGGLERQGLLMSLIQKHQEVTSAKNLPPLHAAQIVQLSQELGRLIDQVAWAGISLDDLSQLVDEDFAHHWQVTLDFLKIVAQFWPEILSEKQSVDPAQRQRHLMQAYGHIWQQNPPDTPIIAAGSTGTIPATAELLRVIQSLPTGRVVLPGLDRELDEAAGNELDLCHPQYGLHKLLKKFELNHHQVPDLPIVDPQRFQAGQARSALLSKALSPIDQRQDLANLSQAFDKFSYLRCLNTQEEALAIALMVRETLEQDHKTVCISTPDRHLVEHIKSELKRWKIIADDTAGHPLTSTPAGRFVLLMAQFLFQPFSALNLLSILKEPFLKSDFITVLETEIIRGHPPYESFASCLHSIQEQGHDDLHSWLGTLYKSVQSLLEHAQDQPLSFATLFKGFLEGVQSWAGENLWQGEVGEACSDFLRQLLESAGTFPDMAPRDFPEVLQELMAGQTVRQPHGFHERVHIFGPLEARMLKADRVILAGLNEGIWPGHHDTDPWLNRPMREQLGLPLPERRVGLSAHDFSQAFTAPEVILTRSVKSGGTPTVPSRWLLRIETLLQKAGGHYHIDPGQKWIDWAQSLDLSDKVSPCHQPAPRPPVSMRPQQLSVTQIETWMRDPYAIYARHILRLRPLDPLNFAFDALARGTFLHFVLEKYLKSNPDIHDPAAAQKLFEFAQQQYQKRYGGSLLTSFWGHRLRRIAHWFIDQERGHRSELKQSWQEISGQIQIASDFTLTAKADRIDQTHDGATHIIDYKTGVVPSSDDIQKGYASQLALEALIAQHEGFSNVATKSVASLSFWQLTGKNPAGTIKTLKDDPLALAQKAAAGVKTLVDTFRNPFTPYQSCPRPHRAPVFSDYAHLARVAEWSQGGSA